MECDNIKLKELDNKWLIIIGFQVPTNVIKYLIYIFGVITLYIYYLLLIHFKLRVRKYKLKLVE